MNLRMTQLQRRGAAGTRGFTMVELALCIAIIAIAMTAIIGVLPAGLNVQRQNREETIVNQDASVLLEAIRNGSLRVDDLTNYVDFISVTRTSVADRGRTVITNGFRGYWYTNAVPSPDYVLANPWEIVGLLSLPKDDGLPNEKQYTNSVVAQFRSFSGALNDKPYPAALNATPDPTALSLAFRYLVTVKISPGFTQPFTALATEKGAPADVVLENRKVSAMGAAFYDVSLQFQWPVYTLGPQFPPKVGNSSRTFRTQVAGQLLALVDPKTGLHTNFPGTTLSPRRFVPGAVSLPPSQ
jgi:prepilin-type N-terminal cleavage/methylation domain-containing protein